MPSELDVLVNVESAMYHVYADGGFNGPADVDAFQKSLMELRKLMQKKKNANETVIEALEWTLAYLTNVNAIDESTLAGKVIGALEQAGYDKEKLDEAALAMLKGAAHA